MMNADEQRTPAYLAPATVALSGEELWALDLYFRNHQQMGHRWDEVWAQAVHAGIVSYESQPKEKRPDFTHDLTLPVSAWWWVEAQVPQGIQVGIDKEFGRKLRVKVFRALQPQQQHEVEDADAKLWADVGDAIASADTHADAGGGAPAPAGS